MRLTSNRLTREGNSEEDPRALEDVKTTKKSLRLG